MGTYVLKKPWTVICGCILWNIAGLDTKRERLAWQCIQAFVILHRFTEKPIKVSTLNYVYIYHEDMTGYHCQGNGLWTRHIYNMSDYLTGVGHIDKQQVWSTPITLSHRVTFKRFCYSNEIFDPILIATTISSSICIVNYICYYNRHSMTLTLKIHTS